MRYLITSLLLVIAVLATGQESLRVGLYQGYKFSSASLVLKTGEYEVLVDGIWKQTLATPAQYQVYSESGGVRLEGQGTVLKGTYKIEVRHKGGIGQFRLNPGVQAAKQQPYSGNLVIRHCSSKLVLINELELEKYVEGVVEAETGKGRDLEFYKAQAVISRTYAMGNRPRHEKEGFHVCDRVHCQVYHGVARHDANIPIATKATKSLVLVDADINLITATFSANCGGQTVSSGYVWTKALPYLQSKKDTFCLSMPSSHWEKTIPTTKWDSYLASKAKAHTDTTTHAPGWQPAEKTMYFTQDSLRIRLTDMRSDLGLRSCWFSVMQDGDDTILVGRGFGHGVGLCQQGAIRRAELGSDFRTILHFYYTGVHIIPSSQMDFFQSPPLLDP